MSQPQQPRRPQARTQTQDRPQSNQQQPTPQPALVTRDEAIAKVSGTFSEPRQINARLSYALRSFNLVSPAAHVGTLPPGCEVAFSVVLVEPDNETYPVGSGKRALSKSALDRIAASVGVSWDGRASGRCDDGSDPHYCHFKATGRYRAFDGQVQEITRNKEMDMRDGSPQVVKIEHEARNAKIKRDPENQIREMRAHILAHAETKAMLRVIRSLGVLSSYSPADLQKPFVCVRIMFTGKTDDPELRKAFALKTADAFLGGVHTLYGGQQPEHHAHHAALPPPAAAHVPHMPPPTGVSARRDQRVADDRDDDDDDDNYVAGDFTDAEGEDVTRPSSQPQEYVIPAGTHAGVPLSKAAGEHLQYWATRLGADLDEGVSRDPEGDGALHSALIDEIARRERSGEPKPKQQELKT